MLRRLSAGILFGLIVAFFPFVSPAHGATSIVEPSACKSVERAVRIRDGCCVANGSVKSKDEIATLLKNSIKTEIRIPSVGQDVVCTSYAPNGVPSAQEHFGIVADLSEYIAGFYKFFVGIIGVLAVVMILYGAIQWIAAAGNPGKIGAAKEQISSALIGVVLALASYAILNLINPKLVLLELPVVKNVTPTQQRILFSSVWCKDFPGASVTPVVAGKAGCGDEGQTSDGQTCVYGGCPTYEVCLPPNGVVGTYACYSPTDPDEIDAYCEDADKNTCSKVDAEIVSATRNVQNLGKACRLSIENAVSVDAFSKNTCRWGEILDCADLGPDWERVGCSSGGTTCWDGSKPRDCVPDIPYDRDSFCTDDERAAKGADSICCKKRNTTEYDCHF